MLVDIDMSKLSDKTERLNIAFPLSLFAVLTLWQPTSQRLFFP